MTYFKVISRVVVALSIYVKILEMGGEDGLDQIREKRFPEDFLLPYSEIPKDIPDPYFFSLSKGRLFIDYFGSHHSYDPKDPMYEELTVRWNEFKEKTGGRNCYVVIEGGGTGARPIAPEPRQAIGRHGEKGFIWNMAFRSRIPVVSPEPKADAEIKHLLERGYSQDHIAYYYLMRVVPQWHQYEPPIEWAKFVQAYLHRFGGIEEFQRLDFSDETIARVHQELFQKKLDLGDGKFFYDLTDPARTDNPINQIAGNVARLRDESAVRYIAQLWERKKSAFVVYGYEHAVVQEPALRRLVGTVPPTLR